MNKVLFLDFDGVINPLRRTRQEGDDLFDRDKMLLLADVINRTRAKIVLTTSWQSHWSRNPEQCDETGNLINAEFSSYGLAISDKTGGDSRHKAEGVHRWLCENTVDKFLIVDDEPFIWGDLSEKMLRINGFRGLCENDLKKIVAILGEE